MSGSTVEDRHGLSVRLRVQNFGAFLSGMVMPNIGAFIAWGLVTAFFIPSGWTPNAELARMVTPMLIYLLPLLIAYTGGHKIYGLRGGVLGATVTTGAIVGAGEPMFLAAMVLGPGSAWVIKKIDGLVDGKIKNGFEMLVNNYLAGIVAMALAIMAFYGIVPVMASLGHFLSDIVRTIIVWGLLPLVNVVVEPAKVLFLNNALNHGVFTPIGIAQVQETGQSIMFMVESNPGPGVGLLLAYILFGTGSARKTAPGAAVIQFFGGIHEIYFPYVLIKPSLVLAVIAGGVAGTLTFGITGVGLVSPASPGSVIALMGMAAKGSHFGVLCGIVVAAVVSFVVSVLVLGLGKSDADGGYDDNLDEGTGKKTVMSGAAVKTVVFACDAGMGSSAMGAGVLRSKFRKSGIKIDVTNTSIGQLPVDADVVITHKDLTPRARVKNSRAIHISVDDFLFAPEYDDLIAALRERS